MATDETADRLGRLCVQAGEDLRARAVRYGVHDVLTRLTAAARDDSIHTAQLAADLDRLDDAFARHGIDGLTSGQRTYERWAGGGGHPVVALWACPAARPCDRLVPGDERPRCELLDEPFVTRKIAL
jgi:hypothetical protein